MGSDEELARAAIDRLASVIPSHNAAFWETLNPPASSDDLQALREAVHPFLIPRSLEIWLGFANGQTWESVIWWPTMECGAMLSAESMVKSRGFYTTQLKYPTGWLTISSGGHTQSSIELVTERTPVIINSSVDDFARVAAPSLGAMLTVTAELADAGYLDSPFPDGLDLVKRLEFTRERFDALGWGDYPFAPDEAITNDRYLPEWGNGQVNFQ